MSKTKIETLPEERSPSGMVRVTRCRCGDLNCTALLFFDGSMKGVAVGGGYMTLQCAIRKELITREQALEAGSGGKPLSVGVIGLGSRPGTLGD